MTNTSFSSGFGSGLQLGAIRTAQDRTELAQQQNDQRQKEVLRKNIDTNIQAAMAETAKAVKLAEPILSTAQGAERQKAESTLAAHRGAIFDDTSVLLNEAVKNGLITEAEAAIRSKQVAISGEVSDVLAQQKVEARGQKMTSQAQAEGKLPSQIALEQERARTRAVPTNQTLTTNEMTTANRTKQENELFSSEQIAQEARELAERLTRADVGFRGKMGEVFLDEGIGQIFTTAVNGDRVANRQAIRTMREKALRTMTTDNRLNREDRAGVEKIFPKDSVVESITAAKIKLDSLAELMEQRAARAAGLLQGKATHQMSPDELIDAVKTGAMTRDSAKRALKVYHGYE